MVSSPVSAGEQTCFGWLDPSRPARLLHNASVAENAEMKKMPSRRSTLLFLSLSAVIFFAAPLWTLPASAKDNGKGNGNSSGNNGNGNGNGNGNRNGDRGGKGSANGTGNAKTPAASSGTKAAVVKHSNGLEESVVRGRYIMKDNKGRTIVNRRASRADRERLEALQR